MEEKTATAEGEQRKTIHMTLKALSEIITCVFKKKGNIIKEDLLFCVEKYKGKVVISLTELFTVPWVKKGLAWLRILLTALETFQGCSGI